ncbi:MAG: DNA alkylation repair protein [Oscillospiraceae bacterium]
MRKVYEEIQQRLLALSEPKYREFSAKLLPNSGNIIGVRLPILRGLSKELARGAWREYFAQNRHEYMEETMLQGMTIGALSEDIDAVLAQVRCFLPHINNWSVCDSFCAGLKITKSNKEKMWSFLREYLQSDSPFEIRFALVMLLDYYIDEEHIENIQKAFDEIKNEDYYVRMSLAWALSMCYVKLPAQTLPYLKNNTLDTFTYNKALQKICESRRVDDETRALMRSMKRNANNPLST